MDRPDAVEGLVSEHGTRHHAIDGSRRARSLDDYTELGPVAAKTVRRLTPAPDHFSFGSNQWNGLSF